MAEKQIELQTPAPAAHPTLHPRSQRRRSSVAFGRKTPNLVEAKKLMTKPQRTHLMNTLISDYNTRCVLKLEFRRLRTRFQKVWSNEDRKVQTWQSLYEHEMHDVDNGWQQHAEEHNKSMAGMPGLSETGSNYNMQGFTSAGSFGVGRSPSNSADKDSFSSFSSMTKLDLGGSSSYSDVDFGIPSHQPDDTTMRYNLRQATSQAQKAHGSDDIDNTISQALLDRLLLLSLWQTERDINKDLVSQLLTAGADPNWISPRTADLGTGNQPIFYGRSALHFAAYKGHVECLELLLNANANLSALDEFDSTPLHLASLQGELASVRSLISKGINLYAEDRYGKTCLHLAFEALDFNAESLRFNEVQASNNWLDDQSIHRKKEAVLAHHRHIHNWHAGIHEEIQNRRRKLQQQREKWQTVAVLPQTTFSDLNPHTKQQREDWDKVDGTFSPSHQSTRHSQQLTGHLDNIKPTLKRIISVDEE